MKQLWEYVDKINRANAFILFKAIFNEPKSFMTPVEGRSSEKKNRVRCFPNDELVSDVRNEKWDLVKVFCTQSFNKRVQYGVSFIKIHTNDETTANSAKLNVNDSPKVKPKCGEVLNLAENNAFSQFRMREDSSDSDKESGTPSALFQKHKETKNEEPSNAIPLSGKFKSTEIIREYFLFESCL